MIQYDSKLYDRNLGLIVFYLKNYQENQTKSNLTLLRGMTFGKILIESQIPEK